MVITRMISDWRRLFYLSGAATSSGITELEGDLLNLVLMAGQVDRVAGIQHDRDELRAEQEKQKQQKGSSNGEGPQMHADMREDVVSGQDDVDDLLSSLGF